MATPSLGVPGALVDNIIRGLAAFVATRAQQEALVAVYDSLQGEVCSVPDRAFWVSNLCALQLKDVLGAGAAFAGVVRAALLEDLKSLPQRIVDLAGWVHVDAELPDSLLTNPLFRRLAAYDVGRGIVTLRLVASDAEMRELRKLFVAAKSKTVFDALESKGSLAANELMIPRELIRIARGVLSGRDVLLALAHLSTAEVCRGQDPICDVVERVLNDVGRVARQAAMGLEEARKLFPDQWPGLDDPRARGIVVATLESLKILPLEDVRIVVDRIAQLDRTLRRLRSAKKRDIADTVDTVVAAIDVMGVSLEVVARIVGSNDDVDANAIARLTDLSDNVRSVRAITEAIAARDYGPLLIEAQSLVRLISRAGRVSVEIPDTVQRFIVLGTSLGSAESADEVKSILESTAASVGGWRLKRRSGVVVSLTAFPGLALGVEDLALEGAKNDSSFAGYLFAPVGLDIAFCGSRAFGPGVFLSAIDVGQLLSVPLDGEELETPAEDGSAAEGMVEREETIRFVQVFSPGIFVRFGIADLPLVVGGGVSYLPRLRKVTTDDDGFDVNALRVIGFVAVDVTILPF